MHTIMIDGSRYHSSMELHQALKNMLSLPDYYGMNADALTDCLSERRERVHLWILDPGSGDVASALKMISVVIADNGGIVREL